MTCQRPSQAGSEPILAADGPRPPSISQVAFFASVASCSRCGSGPGGENEICTAAQVGSGTHGTFHVEPGPGPTKGVRDGEDVTFEAFFRIFEVILKES